MVLPGLIAVQSATPAAEPKPLVPFPHPLVTEILYNVPAGGDGDANHDGVRSAARDEFIEIVNPHEKPIELIGYTLSDRRAAEKDKSGKPKSGAVRFVFPRCTLQPGQVAVVFNGYEAKWEGPVGDQNVAPSGPNPGFADAMVFTLRNAVERTGLANNADWVLLSDPKGSPVQLVKWGAVEGTVAGCPLIEEAPNAVQCSVQRTSEYGRLEPHQRVETERGERRFSPGTFSLVNAPKAPAPAKKNADPAAAKPKPVEKSKSAPRPEAEPATKPAPSEDPSPERKP